MSKEIQRAAIKCKYQIFTGFEHGECFKQLENHHKEAEIIQGFITNEGEFVDRQEAMIIAKIANQLQYDTDKKTLISEDLHIDWLHKQDHKIKELEHRLANCLEPKFKIGQEVWCVYKYWYNGVLSEIRNKLFDEIFVEITEIHIEKDYTSYIFQPKPRQNRFGYDDFEFKDNLLYQMRNFGDTRYIDNYWLFATEEEARKKLEELKNG